MDSSEAGALRRGLRLMRALQQSGAEGLKVADLARIAALPRPTVYRLIRVLLDENFVHEQPGTRRYLAVSGEPPEAGGKWRDLVRLLTPGMQRVAAQTGNSVFLVRRMGGDSLCLHREFGGFPIQVHSIAIGGRQPLGVGAAGLALLAAFDEGTAEVILRKNAPRLHAYSGLTVDILRKLVRNARVRGYSVVGGFAAPGILGVGIPILSPSGKPVAGISTSSISERMPLKLQKEVAALLRDAIAVAARQYD